MKIHTSILNYLTSLLFPEPVEREFHALLTPSALREHLKRSEDATEKWISSIFSYDTPLIHNLIHEMKYTKPEPYVNMFKTLLTEEILLFIEEEQTLGHYASPILIAIPLHKTKKHERGYNQCQLLAEAVQKELAIENCSHLLAKTKETKSQTQTNTKKEREENVKGVFTCTNKKGVRGRDIILIDDITTTGATLKEARHTLLKAGARSVNAFTIAH